MGGARPRICRTLKPLGRGVVLRAISDTAASAGLSNPSGTRIGSQSPGPAWPLASSESPSAAAAADRTDRVELLDCGLSKSSATQAMQRIAKNAILTTCATTLTVDLTLGCNSFTEYGSQP